MRRAFTLIETLVVVAVVGLLTVGFVYTVNTTWADLDPQWSAKTVDSLNLAMTTYRGYRARGFTPQSPWSATDAPGVLAELAKPLVKEGVSIVVMPTAPLIDVSKLNLQPSTFGQDAVWSQGT